jgi:hypothetical protein
VRVGVRGRFDPNPTVIKKIIISFHGIYSNTKNKLGGGEYIPPKFAMTEIFTTLILL